VAQESTPRQTNDSHRSIKTGAPRCLPERGPTNQRFGFRPSKGSNRRLRLTESGTTRARALESDLELTRLRVPHSSCSRPTKVASRGIPSRESFCALSPN
jgi:hypothetical protein